LPNSLDLNTLREISGSRSLDIDAIRRSLDLFLKKINGSDGIIISIGIVALITGILVDLFVVRLMCLLLVFGSAGVLVALLRSRQIDVAEPPVIKSEPYPGRKQTGHGVKKLFFDDYQQAEDSDGFEVVIPRAPVVTEQLPRAPQHVTPPRPAVPQATVKNQVAPPREFQISDFFDMDASIYQSETDPRTEFNFLLQKILRLMKDVLFAHSVVFFWANREKQQMVMEARVSESQGIMTARRFAIGHDLISRVVGTSKPEVINDVNPDSERELLPYYTVPASVK
jgi:hypothetical protein